MTDEELFGLKDANPEFDLASGRKDRDEGIERVRRREWADSYQRFMLMLPDGFTGLAEKFHAEMRNLGIPAPHHHNAWSANFNAAKKRGIVVETGEDGQMERRTSHGRAHCPVMKLVKEAAR